MGTGRKRAVREPATFPVRVQVGGGRGDQEVSGPLQELAVPRNDALCSVRAKSSIQRDSSDSKTSRDGHVGPEGEAESRSRSVWSNERGGYYGGIQ